MAVVSVSSVYYHRHTQPSTVQAMPCRQDQNRGCATNPCSINAGRIIPLWNLRSTHQKGAQRMAITDTTGSEQNPQSARRNDFSGAQISRLFLLLPEDLSASNYSGAANALQSNLRCDRPASRSALFL